MALPLVIASMSAARYYAGTDLGATDWMTIDRERIERFATATGGPDGPAPLPRPATAPDYLLLSMVPTLLPRLIVLLGWASAINAGARACRFIEPVPESARVRMTSRLARARTLPGHGCQLSFDVAFEAEGADATVCSANVSYFYYP